MLRSILLLALVPLPALAEERTTSAGQVEITEMAEGLDTPWSIAFLPGGAWLVTERGGRLLLVEDGASRPVRGVPKVWANGQGGLFDVVVPRDFAQSGEIFLTYAEPRGKAAGTALAVARLDTEAARLSDLRVLFQQEPPATGGVHFGGRLVEAPDGTLFLTLGERGERDSARDLGNDRGKIVHLTRDGAPAPGGPFVQKARPELWSTGHRNPQGLAIGLDGALWEVEHGPQGGDEINLIRPGLDYGWPIATAGEEYGGGKIGVGPTAPGLEPPLHTWVPSIAPSGLMVYSGKLWPDWRGDLFTGSLKFDFISRLSPDGRTEQERLFEGTFPRIRDIREAPDGSIWFLSETDGTALRMTPVR